MHGEKHGSYQIKSAQQTTRPSLLLVFWYYS